METRSKKISSIKIIKKGIENHRCGYHICITFQNNKTKNDFMTAYDLVEKYEKYLNSASPFFKEITDEYNFYKSLPKENLSLLPWGKDEPDIHAGWEVGSLPTKGIQRDIKEELVPFDPLFLSDMANVKLHTHSPSDNCNASCKFFKSSNSSPSIHPMITRSKEKNIMKNK